jgi:hypothetical protein
VIHVIAAQAAPLNEATAIPRIQQFLVNQRSIEAIAAEMKQLKASAHIEYVGETATELAEADPRPVATAAGPVAPNALPATQLPESSLDKGVRGLR